MITDKFDALLADKGYDADAIREELAKAEIEVVISAKRNRKHPAPHDDEKYMWRNPIERLFIKFTKRRRAAARYDKTKEAYLGFVESAAVKHRLHFFS
jgi:transposase